MLAALMGVNAMVGTRSRGGRAGAEDAIQAHGARCLTAFSMCRLLTSHHGCAIIVPVSHVRRVRLREVMCPGLLLGRVQTGL